MKRDNLSQSLQLSFCTRSPRNVLYLGEDRLNSMAVNLVKESRHIGTPRASFKQRFHQFQKRRERDRYRVVIASFRSKNKKWVVAKKKEKVSSHTFSFPPLRQLTVSDDECYRGDILVMNLQKASEVSLLEGAGTLCTTVKERSDGIFMQGRFMEFEDVDVVKRLACRVCTGNKQPTDPGRANRVCERGGLEVMRRDLKKLRVGYKKGILRRKLLLLTGFDLEKLLKSLDVHLSENLSKETLFLFIHLEDKVDFSGASKGNDRRWVSDTVKKKLRNVKDDVNKERSLCVLLKLLSHYQDVNCYRLIKINKDVVAMISNKFICLVRDQSTLIETMSTQLFQFHLGNLVKIDTNCEVSQSSRPPELLFGEWQEQENLRATREAQNIDMTVENRPFDMKKKTCSTHVWKSLSKDPLLQFAFLGKVSRFRNRVSSDGKLLELFFSKLVSIIENTTA
ncbi:hypothetical protein AT2G10615 [Arabidopsis thaliana]|uniref:Uncharacterized protein n=1 Tax=Arabidopsis thaliana TaxID=3702 RepID=A0A1P8AY89_ARATH|nr:uncharacterized protein AT2G10615 [Arabidopsis thaliana]ANM61639.1 hypothetical protein AT2G10615 [Arabidopsis thaliana]|eukprot:NP_001323844.1 hypothetical protein AT2G10615 [Arabidopsis thaliana]